MDVLRDVHSFVSTLSSFRQPVSACRTYERNYSVPRGKASRALQTQNRTRAVVHSCATEPKPAHTSTAASERILAKHAERPTGIAPRRHSIVSHCSSVFPASSFLKEKQHCSSEQQASKEAERLKCLCVYAAAVKVAVPVLIYLRSFVSCNLLRSCHLKYKTPSNRLPVKLLLKRIR